MIYVKWQVNVITVVLQETFYVEILYVQQQENIITTVLQESFYRETDLYIGVVYISLRRDLKSLQLLEYI